jgi:hypothetical protein
VPLAIAGAMLGAWVLVRLLRLPSAPVCAIAAALFAVLIVNASGYW